MTWQKPDTSYWNNKFAAWWHDPVDKVFDIRKHEIWASEYLGVFGLDRPNDEYWKMADAIAAGFERGQVPSYSADPNKNGAVDFAEAPVITHPTSGKDGLLKLAGLELTPEEIHAANLEFLKRNIGMEAGMSDYAACFENEPGRFAVARLLYTHLVLRFALAENNVGGLGALWHRIPADSRFPDHSIWQHNALCSAIYSCIEMGGTPEDVGVMVFSITPVQLFISRARKMRDYWVGSVLLSWLAFEGLRWVMENLGVDHVLYPSLIDQPLVNVYLEKNWHISGSFKPVMWEGQPRDIASLPNKFMFLVPIGKADSIALELKEAITGNWQELSQLTLAHLADKEMVTAEELKHLGEMFRRQTSRFWDFQWSVARLAADSDKEELLSLLDESAIESQFKFLKAIRPILEKNRYSVSNASRGILYSTSHHLAQSALAAQKSRRLADRAGEPGEKCQLCGEYEVLHDKPWQGENAAEYNAGIKNFWERFQNGDFNKNEHLCAVCFIKRYVPKVLKKNGTHILNNIFGDADSFPSTTEMALTDYFRRTNILDDGQKKDIANKLHESKADSVNIRGKNKIDNADKYYALLLMDGDNIGKLIHGKSIAASWEKIMHPDIVGRLAKDQFDSLYREAWQRIFYDKQLGKRLVTPAIHAAISEALGDFSIYGVAPIIKKNHGRLIYAGGDDVCAFLPIGNVLAAAREIKEYYTSVFRFIGVDRLSNALRNDWKPMPGKLSVNLGVGDDISISAAILICHHKESLKQMIERAQQLLKEEAKKRAGRNACAIELRKRHGGGRCFTRKWGDWENDRVNREIWKAFESIAKLAGGKNREISHSLLYRLETMRPGIEAIITHDKNAEANLPAFIAKQLERSDTKSEHPPEEIARWVTEIVWDRENSRKPFNPEGLLIAGFLGGEG